MLAYTIDEKRIWAFGHSNGGFMVNRMACDMADKIAGIVSMAGETYKNQIRSARPRRPSRSSRCRATPT